MVWLSPRLLRLKFRRVQRSQAVTEKQISLIYQLFVNALLLFDGNQITIARKPGKKQKQSLRKEANQSDVSAICRCVVVV